MDKNCLYEIKLGSKLTYEKLFSITEEEVSSFFSDSQYNKFFIYKAHVDVYTNSAEILLHLFYKALSFEKEFLIPLPLLPDMRKIDLNYKDYILNPIYSMELQDLKQLSKIRVKSFISDLNN